MKDIGCDPLMNGMYRMVPSGDIVDYDERMRRLPIVEIDARIENELPGMIGGANEMQVNCMQGGKMDIFD